jgi:hypothetical protein
MRYGIAVFAPQQALTPLGSLSHCHVVSLNGGLPLACDDFWALWIAERLVPLRGPATRSSVRLVEPVSHTASARLLVDPNRPHMHLADVAKASCAWDYVSSRMRRSPVSHCHKKGVQCLYSLCSSSKPVFRRSLKSLQIACPVPPSHSFSIPLRDHHGSHTFSLFA